MTEVAEMTSAGLRIYTTVIALICGGAVAWSIHQASLASSWQADARSWHSVAQRTVAHDHMTAAHMRRLVGRYNELVIRTRRSERRLLSAMRRSQANGAAMPTGSFTSVAAPISATASAPVAAPAPAAPTTKTS
jgi:hypothetical protein